MCVHFLSFAQGYVGSDQLSSLHLDCTLSFSPSGLSYYNRRRTLFLTLDTHWLSLNSHCTPFFVYNFFLKMLIKWCQCYVRKEAVKAHHLLVSKCLYSSPLVPCEARRATAQHQSVASGLRWNAKHRVNPVFMLTVSFDKRLFELTYGNLVMTCLHTVISSAFHPYFLGLTIVPIMSVIVNVLHSLFM